MHHIYHTEGIILGSRNSGEAGRYYYIFTKELGMVVASAQGVRKMASKLRYVLQDFSCIKVDLVRGKDFWRVTSASKTNTLESITKKPEILAVVSRMSYLLRRLLSGEEPNEALFEEVRGWLSVLEKAETPEEVSSAEILAVLRILNNLGYIGSSDTLSPLVQSPFEKELVLEASKNRSAIISTINKALRETHL